MLRIPPPPPKSALGSLFGRTEPVGLNTEGRKSPEMREGWVRSGFIPKSSVSLGKRHALPEPQSCVGAHRDPTAALFTPLSPTAGSSGQGMSPAACHPAAISGPGPLGAAILPAMDFPAGGKGKGWQSPPHVAGGNCSSSRSPESAFFFFSLKKKHLIHSCVKHQTGQGYPSGFPAGVAAEGISPSSAFCITF